MTIDDRKSVLIFLAYVVTMFAHDKIGHKKWTCILFCWSVHHIKIHLSGKFRWKCGTKTGKGREEGNKLKQQIFLKTEYCYN